MAILPVFSSPDGINCSCSCPTKYVSGHDPMLQALYSQSKAADLRTLLTLNRKPQGEGMANINLTLVTCTEVLFKYWDLVAAIYHARDDWLKYGIVNGQGLHINTKLVIPWMADDELELAIKHNHGAYRKEEAMQAVRNLRSIRTNGQTSEEDLKATPKIKTLTEPMRVLGCVRQQCEEVARGITKEQQQQGQIGTSMVVVLTQSSEISTLIKAHGMDAVSPDAFVKLLPVQQRALLWPYLPAGRADYHLPEWHQLVNAARNKLLADHQKALAVVLTSQAIGTVSPPLIDAGGVTKAIDKAASGKVTSSLSPGTNMVAAPGNLSETPLSQASEQRVRAFPGVSEQNLLPSNAGRGPVDQPVIGAIKSCGSSHDIPYCEDLRGTTQQLATPPGVYSYAQVVGLHWCLLRSIPTWDSSVPTFNEGHHHRTLCSSVQLAEHVWPFRLVGSCSTGSTMTVSDEESVLSSDDLHTERDHWDSILYLIDMIDYGFTLDAYEDAELNFVLQLIIGKASIRMPLEPCEEGLIWALGESSRSKRVQTEGRLPYRYRAGVRVALGVGLSDFTALLPRLTAPAWIQRAVTVVSFYKILFFGPGNDKEEEEEDEQEVARMDKVLTHLQLQLNVCNSNNESADDNAW